MFYLLEVGAVDGRVRHLKDHVAVIVRVAVVVQRRRHPRVLGRHGTRVIHAILLIESGCALRVLALGVDEVDGHTGSQETKDGSQDDTGNSTTGETRLGVGSGLGAAGASKSASVGGFIGCGGCFSLTR